VSKLNSEFNYKYQVIGETPWAKIQTLQGFLNGRKRAAVLEEVSALKRQAKLEELRFLKENNGALHVILTMQAEMLEADSFLEEQTKSFQDNRDEIAIIEKLLAQLYEIVEPTRIEGYSDEQMFEVNAANEFTATIGKDIQAEIICSGRASPAKLRNAMSNPYTFMALKQAGLIPDSAVMLNCKTDPLAVEFCVEENQLLLG
jgi:hypothetical protein